MMFGSNRDLPGTLADCHRECKTCTWRYFQPQSEAPAMSLGTITTMGGSGEAMEQVMCKPNCCACIVTFTVKHGFCMTANAFPHPTLHIPIDDDLLYDAIESKFNG
jgi:hypothetical protein